MKQLIKKIVPNRIKNKILSQTFFFGQKDNVGWIDVLLKGHLHRPNPTLSDMQGYAEVFSKIIKTAKIKRYGRWIYPFDAWHFRKLSPGISGICSITVDYRIVIESNLNEIKSRLTNLNTSEFTNTCHSVIDSIEGLARRAGKLKTSNASLFPELLYRKPKDFVEALQKILFYNALFWQMNHMHVGLGRLDMILYPYYKKDINNGRISIAEVKQLLKEFCNVLHADYKAKSAGLVGDTGQCILLGGIDDKGNNVENDVTRCFLEIFVESPMPDPKLILRINDNTSAEIWNLAVKSILAGSGSPLLMNETQIMKNMTAFGYDADDVWQLGTSACWEPLIIGKSFDQNNPFQSASTLAALNSVVLSDKDYQNFDELFKDFEHEFTVEIKSVVKENVQFDCSPLYSLFFDDCISRGHDYTKGGALYAHHGVQVVGLPNTVNALLNIESLVFEQKILSLQTLRQVLVANFVGYEDIRQLLLSTAYKYGSCEDKVVKMTNKLMDIASETVHSIRCNGETLKVGFSSPNFLWLGKKIGASADGRKSGEPMAVHISPISSDIDIAEIMDFSTRLNYSGNRLNGNVVDFIVPPTYAHNPEKLVTILKSAIKNGTFEIQLNVLDKETLIDAKLHPERHADLIVRVWGFSAYFNDLPEEFKDNLISRAQTYSN